VPNFVILSRETCHLRHDRLVPHGYEGWDDYAPFYDWENAQTLGKRDVPFWRRLARGSLQRWPAAERRVLELGCGTGRVTFPLAQEGVAIVGVDRSAEMLQRARVRQRRLRKKRSIHLVRGDIRSLPFPRDVFPLVIAPYGILQSLLHDRDLIATLAAVHQTLAPGGLFGLELVADLPSWREYNDRVTLRGRRGSGARITLTESVRQDRARKLTLFDQVYEERHGGRVTKKQFTLTFRTLTVHQMAARLQRAGFDAITLLGDYQGGPWDMRAETWIVLAQKA
jgi:SAM-dependent methyltransferase